DGLHIDAPGPSPFLAVWPNPVRSGDIAHVKAGIAGGESGILTVCNLRGQVIAEYRLSPGTCQIDLNCGGLPAGIYLCGLRTRSGRSVRKILLLN
ncbi:MAG: T9SS type A sorting domain-containing protein, partial [Candidatus Syntrophosphaera sp.]